MKTSIRTSALLMVLVPTLIMSLALSAWYTRLRVRDARTELQSRGDRESSYLASAAELALLVGDSETLQRLAASNLRGAGAPTAVLFLDAQGGVLAAAGSEWEIGLARLCWLRPADCAGGEQRYLFQRDVHAGAKGDADATFGATAPTPATGAERLIGRVVLSFDPRHLEGILHAMFLNTTGVTLAALLLAVLVAGFFSRRLGEPMQRLSSVVASIRAGELHVRTNPSGAGELRELEEGVNAMADRVESASADLNRRIDEATAELHLTLLEREERNRELDAALARAAAASQAKDLFLARMSHELRTPLTTVTGYARLMQQSESPEQRADFYRTIAQASGILIATVDDILDFVKLESGSLHLERREFDLESCIEDAVMMQAPQAYQKGLDLLCEVRTAPGLRVVGDALRLSQVLSNLLSNAIKFTPSGSVRVRVSRVDEGGANFRARIDVIDTGIGIPGESIPHLFQPFAQADESMTRRFGGSGLGLSISASIVRAMGGDIRLESEPGTGTTVSVELPFDQAPPEDDDTPWLDACVVLAAAADSPHAAIVREYLAGRLRELHALDPDAPVSAAIAGADLVLLIECGGVRIDPRWCDGTVPVLRLRPVEVLTDPRSRYLADCLPLPLRRRDLLAAIRRLLGVVDRIAEPAPSLRRERFALRCLVVEDNELNRRLIATQLADMGVTVLQAAGGATALALLENAAGVDLVLLDVHMPEMDGVTLARHIRLRWPALPMVALTANVVGSEEVALREAGVREVLYKPLDEERVVALLSRIADAEATGTTLHLPHGITAAEVHAECARLTAMVRDTLARDGCAAAVDAAHQLLGVARMFTRGALENRCLALEAALRDGDASYATELLCRVDAIVMTLR